MDKQEFITKLNGKLFLLNEKERQDIIQEYVEHINLKMQDGKSEDDAIKDFGDLDELSKGILEAYHIDNTQIQHKTMDTYIKQGVDYINKTTERILSFNGSELTKLIVEFLLIIIVLALIQIPFDIISSVLSGFFAWAPYSVYRVVSAVLQLFASLGSLALGILIIYSFINNRILNKTPSVVKQHEDLQQDVETEQFLENQENISQVDSVANIPNQDKQIEKAANHEKYNKVSDSYIVNILTWIIKAFAFLCLWLPSAITTIVTVVLTVLSIILYMGSGIGFIGICIAGVGCCVIALSFTSWLTSMIMGKGKNNE